MKQAIAGVAPFDLEEVTSMVVWPSISTYGLGRWIGRMCRVQAGFGKFFTLGKLFALMLIPLAVKLFVFSLLPGVIRRYRLTNRRIIIQRGLLPVDEASVRLDEFDSIEVQVRPGQEFFPAGDLVFRRGPVEVFFLSAVPRPETFRRACLKAHQAYVAVQAVLHKGDS